MKIDKSMIIFSIHQSLLKAFSFNKAIAKIYELTNFLARKDTRIEQRIYGIKSLALLMEPFTPHLSQEIWVTIGEKGLIAEAKWPDIKEWEINKEENNNLTYSDKWKKKN